MVRPGPGRDRAADRLVAGEGAVQNAFAASQRRQLLLELWLAGDRKAAGDRVPVEIGFGTNLIGPPDLVKQRLRLYRDAGVTTVRAGLTGADTSARLETLGLLLDLVNEVNEEV